MIFQEVLMSYPIIPPNSRVNAIGEMKRLRSVYRVLGILCLLVVVATGYHFGGIWGLVGSAALYLGLDFNSSYTFCTVTINQLVDSLDS
jgi:hypothetical protein